MKSMHSDLKIEFTIEDLREFLSSLFSGQLERTLLSVDSSALRQLNVHMATSFVENIISRNFHEK